MWMEYRDRLRVLAKSEVPAHLRVKLDPDDLVHNALVKVRRFGTIFDGRSEPEIYAYLRRALASAVAEAIRDHDRFKRRAGRELPLDLADDRPGPRGASCLAADQTSPTARARRNEQSTHLADALKELPEGQRRAIELHYFDRLSIDETAGHLGITGAAVAGLLRRGLKQLRGRLVEPIG
jgi:RNA polymerase sigma-70 factor (ECF subfamily)